MSEYEKAAREAGFTIQRFGRVQKIARHKTDGVYLGWHLRKHIASLLEPPASLT